MMDWTVPGAGVGLLWNILFGKNGTNNKNGSIAPTNTPIVNADTGQTLSAGDLAAVSPNPTQATAAYNFANQNPAQANTPGYAPPVSTANTGNALSNLLGGGTGNNNSNPMSTLSSLFNKPQPQVAPVIPPNYAGTGPSAGGLQAMLNPTSMMTPAAMPGSTAPGAPLGPAAMNPMLAMLRSRLGLA